MTTIDREELEQIATQVWELLMGTSIVPSSRSEVPNDIAPRVAHIDLEGAHSCTIALQIDDQLIRAAAATMFGIEGIDVGDGEMADTARELANMVGGNMKCLVEQPTDLGLPQVSPADAFYADHTNVACRLTFEHEGAPLQVMVFE